MGGLRQKEQFQPKEEEAVDIFLEVFSSIFIKVPQGAYKWRATLLFLRDKRVRLTFIVSFHDKEFESGLPRQISTWVGE